MMKKILSLVLSALALTIIISPAKAYAKEHPAHNAVDMAGLLTSSELSDLDAHLKELSRDLDFDIVVVTTHDLEGKSPMAYCDDFYDYGGYGLDDESSGICFLRYISEDGRDYEVWISTTGRGIDVFSDGDIQYQIDLIADDIISGNYYRAFYNFGTNAHDEVKDHYSYHIIWIPLGLGLGLLVAAIATSSMKSALKSVAPAGYATEYVKQGSFKLTGQADSFLYNRLSAVPIPRETSSGGSHSTHRGSSGTSHGGGGRHI